MSNFSPLRLRSFPCYDAVEATEGSTSDAEMCRAV